MNHAANLATAIERAFAVLGCESTPAEMGAHVTREQAEILRDLETWSHDLLAARPKIQPAKEWRSPTAVRMEVARRTGECAAVIERGRRRRR